MINAEDTGPTSATSFDFAMDRNHHFSDSSIALNTGTVQGCLSPTTLPENPTITFASSFPSTPRFSRSLRPNMASIPELQQLNTTDEITLTRRHVSEKLEALPYQVLSHASNVRSILGISGTTDGEPLAGPSSASEEWEGITPQQRMVRLFCYHGSRTWSQQTADYLFDAGGFDC